MENDLNEVLPSSIWFYIGVIVTTLFLSLFFSLVQADVKTFYSKIDDSVNFFETQGISYSDKSLVLNLDSYKTSYQNKLTGQANFEQVINGSWSDFFFANYENNKLYNFEYLRGGVGLGFIPEEARDPLIFPGRHKLSLAIVYDSVGQISYLSWRYKFSTYVAGLGVLYIYNLYKDNSTQDLSLSLKVTDQFSFVYKDSNQWINSKRDANAALGMEIKWQ